MSLAFALYYFSRRLESVQALSFDKRATSICNDLNNCRTTYDIVWSCLTTMFACTWVAIHPNIPAPYESSFEIGLRRLGIVIMALIAPELVIMWATRQWIVSRRLATKHHVEGWTQTHGFFALMGGFMLFDGDKALYTLTPEKLDELVKDGKIMFPQITKEDIEDKSKGDIVSKGFVILQTTWFVLQCIARGVERLPITELELVTLAFAVLNLATYTLWWNKPLNVQCAFPVQLSDERRYRGKKEEQVPSMFKRAILAVQEIMQAGVPNVIFEWLWLPISPFVDIIMGGTIVPEATKVPSFYAGEGDMHRDSEDAIQVLALTVTPIATIFGALHCIAWAFQFPSHEKEIVWRTCSLLITCLPFSMVFITALAALLHGFWEEHYGIAAGVVGLFSYLLFGILFIMPIIYIVARVILLVEAFILLKYIPPGAFQTNLWTTFIPHV
ncbi:hypothetical protein BD410DRAFT_757029 [Rickenella mellea]|uniref:Uncharacterized protein n=1 Tax=Rickenella mellea TaxID=50990 RepID=A0A4Y7PJV0_9AGAM|nr:hypothetical protein BD410DRAFT_757029 [Rickenella mellea]